MDKLAAMQAFVTICDEGSLTAAGETLGKSQPTMVRTLANLEEALGVRLLRRTTRRLSLTDEGRGYLTQCRRILGDIQQALGNTQEARSAWMKSLELKEDPAVQKKLEELPQPVALE